jgi:hypothetical protein
MAARSFAGDLTDAARLGKRIFIGDSDGTARLVKRIFVGDSGGTARLIYSARTFTAGPFDVTDSYVGSPAYAAIGYDANGIVYQSVIAGSTDIGEWTTPSSAGIGSSGGYYIRADIVSGSVDGTSSATGTDLALSLTRSWSVTQNTIGSHAVTLTITIKDGSGGNTLATGTVTLTADVS